jgi:hypothetical protein
VKRLLLLVYYSRATTQKDAQQSEWKILTTLYHCVGSRRSSAPSVHPLVYVRHVGNTDRTLRFSVPHYLGNLYDFSRNRAFCTFMEGKGSLDDGYLYNFNNKFLNKYGKNLKIEKILWIYFYTFRLIIIQISCNFIIVW